MLLLETVIIVRQEAIEMMEQNPIADGAYGIALKEGRIFLPDIANGLGIAGGAPGINSDVEWDPRRGYIVIVLTNFDPPTAGQAARRIISLLPD